MCCVRKNTLNSSRGLSTPEYKWVKTEWSGKTEYKLIMIRQLQHALINRLHVTRFIWCIIAVSLTITLPIFHYTITIATGHLVASARSSRTVTLVWRIATVILAITDPFNVDTTPGVTPESKEKNKTEKTDSLHNVTEEQHQMSPAKMCWVLSVNGYLNSVFEQVRVGHLSSSAPSLQSFSPSHLQS